MFALTASISYANFDESDTDSMKTLVHAFVMSRADFVTPFLPDRQDALLTSYNVC